MRQHWRHEARRSSRPSSGSLLPPPARSTPRWMTTRACRGKVGDGLLCLALRWCWTGTGVSFELVLDPVVPHLGAKVVDVVLLAFLHAAEKKEEERMDRLNDRVAEGIPSVPRKWRPGVSGSWMTAPPPRVARGGTGGSAVRRSFFAALLYLIRDMVIKEYPDRIMEDSTIIWRRRTILTRR